MNEQGSLPIDLAKALVLITNALRRNGELEETVRRLQTENADLKAEMQDYVLLNDQAENEIDRLRARIAQLEQPETLRKQA